MIVRNVSTPETQQSIGTLIDGAAAKATPVDADVLALSDSAASKILKKFSWANLKSALLSYLTAPRATQNTPYILAQSAAPVSFVAVNTGITWALAANPSNGYTRITSSAGHGLTSGVSNGKNVYITSWSGSGAATGFVAVANVVDANNLDLNIPYSAAYGNPAVVQANVEVTLVSVAVPGGAMGPNGRFDVTPTFLLTNSTNTKTIKFRFGSTTPYSTSSLSNIASTQFMLLVRNRNNQSSQVMYPSAFSPYGSNAATTNTSAVDTSQNQNVMLTVQPSVANEFMQLEGYSIVIYPGA